MYYYIKGGYQIFEKGFFHFSEMLILLRKYKNNPQAISFLLDIMESQTEKSVLTEKQDILDSVSQCDVVFDYPIQLPVELFKHIFMSPNEVWLASVEMMDGKATVFFDVAENRRKNNTIEKIKIDKLKPEVIRLIHLVMFF